ncbi:hypothetical protein N7451_006763 [Penicillium sp. IBT 35674x]|nr:hypothetical protein N7451_006763 [Penicillium sp. IBT 35674x]
MATVSRICQSCSKSKVRCIREAENPHVCHRCLRLGRECIYRQKGRRFHGFQKDRCVHFVNSCKCAYNLLSGRKIEALEAEIKEFRASSGDTFQVPLERDANSRSASVTDDEDGKDVIDRKCLSVDKAQTYLQAFRTVMTPHFPFVIIPPDVSVQHLRQERPFLFLAILATASYDNMPMQRFLGAEVKKAVSSRMILNGEISFDLLQGLLVFLAWSHYHTKPHRYTQYLQLAISIIIELRLDRAPHVKPWKTGLKFRDEHTYDRASWNNDEKRAVIGCYYLSSSIAILLQKHSTFSYVPYIEEYCQSLHDANEYPLDHYILHIVQLQRIAEKIDRLSASHTDELVRPGSGAELYVTSIKEDLSTFHKGLPFDLHDSPLLAFHFQSTGLCLYQLGLNMTDQQPPSTLRAINSQILREELSHAAVSAVDSILSFYLSLPPKSELGFTNAQWIQLGFAMLIGYRYTAASQTSEGAEAYLRTLALLRQRVEALSTPSVDHNGDRDCFVEFRGRIIHIQNRLDGAKKDDKTSESLKLIDPGLILQDASSAEWNDLPHELLGNMEDYQWPDNFLLDNPVEEVLSTW